MFILDSRHSIPEEVQITLCDEIWKSDRNTIQDTFNNGLAVLLFS